jgi:hypothetical protein
VYCPANDWVDDNFTAESLAIVQEVARETRKVYKLKGSSKTEQGFLTLEEPMKYKSLQISKMRYIPPKEVKTPMGEDVWRPELWHGLIKTKHDDVATQPGNT